MRSLFLDELNPDEAAAAAGYLRAHAVPSGLEGLYWIFLPPELWSEEQRRAHQGEDTARAYHLAVELGPDWLRVELLVRGENLENRGAATADEPQTLFIWRWVDELARNLNLRTCL